MDFFILLVITGVLVILSLIKDSKKTLKAFQLAGKRLVNIGIPLISVIMIVAIMNWVFPTETIVAVLDSGDKWTAFFSASLIGSLAVMPGFIAFPLGGMLRASGVPYMIVASFTNSLMMVGIATISVEKQYLGLKISLVRNIIAFIISVIVAFVVGLIYGEITL